VVSLGITSGFSVLAAIHFHNQSGRVAEEIRYARPNWNQTPKFEGLKATISQGEPKFRFGIGHSRPQLASYIRKGSSPLTRLALLALGTLSREGRG
jgi:hypothetical protein